MMSKFAFNKLFFWCSSPTTTVSHYCLSHYVDVHFKRNTGRDTSDLQAYFVLEQQLKTNKLLQQFLSQSSEGLSTMIGQHDLYMLAKAQVDNSGQKEKQLKHLITTLELSHPNEDIPQLAKQKTVEAACSRLQADIELTFNAINQRQEAISHLAGKHFNAHIVI